MPAAHRWSTAGYGFLREGERAVEPALTREIFQRAVHHAVRHVIPRVAGVSLNPGGPPPSGELCTIHTQFDGMPASLALCAEVSFLDRMTRHVTQQEQITPEDQADAATELFNVLCGHVVVELYRLTKTKIRFRLPQFTLGCSFPAGDSRLFATNYRSSNQESIQMIQLRRPGPAQPGKAGAAERSEQK